MSTTQTALQQSNTAVTRTQRDIQTLLESDQFKRAVGAALPKHLTADRFVRVALTAMMRTPKLRNCTQESLFKCLLDLSMYGLEPDGRRAHLIPYGNECTLIIDYKGLAELVRRSGDVSYIHADVVYEHDEFEYQFGSGAVLRHKPNLENRGENIRGAYSFVKLKDGSEDFIVLSKQEIEKVRKRSKAAQNGPWVTDWDEMAKKTAFRRHSKWLPLSPETRDAVEHDDDALEIQVDRGEVAGISIDALTPSADENRGHDEVAAAKPIAPVSAPAAPAPSASVPTFATWDDTVDPIADEHGLSIIVAGVEYVRAETNQTWTAKGNAPAAPSAHQKRGGKPGRSADAFDFTSGGQK